MTTFHAVNTMLPVPDPTTGRGGREETTPTTPRPNRAFFPLPDPQPAHASRAEDPSAKTPTRNSFSGLAAQRPLPPTPVTPATENTTHPEADSALSRGDSHRSAISMDSSDAARAHQNEEKGEGSDNESAKSDSSRPAKKKKGQRFFCTDYPPCNLSFTRSEHLARHIRKHTGERPFSCHCSRRFSRMDNLRQHAATVHINEDIPEGSLAATVTRYQRQIRTDRVRPAGAAGRSRAATLGSQGGHSRGHSRNLSTSSIASTSSNMSVNLSQDMRRRPQPLAMAMANDGAARARLSLSAMDAYNPPLTGGPGPQIVEYIPGSTNATTPTSSTFSAATGSPNPYAPGLQSPFSASSRPLSWGGPNVPARRLSVPGGPALTSSEAPAQGPPPYMAPLPSPGGPDYYAQGRPADSDVTHSRRESMSDMELRRRTWHPGSFSGPPPATSGLAYYQTPDAPRPQYTSQPAASQTTRLPGIESFDNLAHRPPSPMQIDAPTARPFSYHAGNTTPPVPRHEKRASISWDTLQRIDRLEIASPNPKRAWSQYQESSTERSTRPVTAPHPGYATQPQHSSAAAPMPGPPLEPPRASLDSPMTPVATKRQGWYQGPINQSPSQTNRPDQRTSSEESSGSEGVSTPSSVMAEYRPAIVHTNGYVEKRASGSMEDPKQGRPPTSIMDRPHPIQGRYVQYQHSPSNLPYPLRRDSAAPIKGDMTRLDALVAVATNEQQAGVNRT